MYNSIYYITELGTTNMLKDVAFVSRVGAMLLLSDGVYNQLGLVWGMLPIMISITMG